MARFGVQESHAQVGTHDPGMVVGERAALISVEFGGQAAAAQRFLEGLMEGPGVGPQVISGMGDQA